MPLDTNFNVDPYYDDYDEAKNFHRVLFRPAVVVQARELTQLQSILQNQIERFGDNIFVQGTVVQGCNFSVDSNYNYVKLPDLRVDGQTVVPSDYVGLRAVSSTTSNLQAIIVNSQNGLESQNPDLHTLFLKYINSGTSNEQTFANDEQLVFYSNTDPSNTSSLVTSLSVKVAPSQINSVNTYPVGTGYAFTVGEGIVFQKGFFVKVEAPITTIISKYSSTPNNVSVGFATTETIITEYTDPSLYDNASGYTNANAPGAHRLKLTPTLVVANTDALPANNFLSLVDWQNGNPVRVNQDTQYNVINKEMARREYETNGNFVINPFKLSVDSIPGSTNYISAVVSSGLGYINGYRVELQNTSRYNIRKGVDTQTLSGQNISIAYGNYVTVKEVAGYFSIGSQVNLYDTAASAVSTEAYSSISPSGNLIGTAEVLSFAYNNGTVDTPSAVYDLYLTNIKMNSGKAFTSVKGVSSDTGISDVILTYNLSTNSNIAVLTDPNFSSLVFSSGKSSVETLNPGDIANTSFVFRKNDTVNVASNGVSSAVTLSGNQQFAYGTGTLTSIAEQSVIAIPTSNIYVSNATGTVTTTNGSPNVTGVATTFTTAYQENDYINVGNSSVKTIKQIKSIANDTFLIVSNSFVNAYTSNAHSKVYPKNIPINFANRNSSITLANTTSMTFTLKGVSNTAETLQSAANVSIYYDVKTITTKAVQKTSNQNRVVCIDTALFAPFTANITCNTGSNVITTTNTSVNNYISPGYSIYISGTNANSSLLGTVSSVNSTAITLASSATANLFTFLAFGGTASCNTANAIITCTNTAVNTYISAGYQIYVASNSYFVGTVASANSSTITLTTNASINISSNALSYSSATNQITYSANNSAGPTGPWSLGFPDVYNLRSVYRISVGNNFTTNSSYLSTGVFAINPNQTDTTYETSQLVINPASSISTLNNGDKLTVVFDVFTIPTSSTPGFFTVDSYPVDDANTSNTSAIQTQNIPLYTTSTGNTISLRDYIDFRVYTTNTIPLSATANLASASANAAIINPISNSTFTSTGFITPNQTFGYDVAYYLGRIDNISLNSDGRIVVQEGTASDNPVPPAQSTVGMPIGSCVVTPYPTLVPSQVASNTVTTIVSTITANQNRRYTMRDINSINNRVTDLEYYSALSLLEKKTSALVIKNANTGLDRFKNGIFVDTFENTLGSNLNDPEYFIGMDTGEASIVPRYDQFKVSLVYNTTENTNTTLHSHRRTGDLITLNYNEVSYLSQGSASKYRNCTDGYYSWVGNMATSPAYDSYIDTRISPISPVNPVVLPVNPPVPTVVNNQPVIANSSNTLPNYSNSVPTDGGTPNDSPTAIPTTITITGGGTGLIDLGLLGTGPLQINPFTVDYVVLPTIPIIDPQASTQVGGLGIGSIDLGLSSTGYLQNS
jgi:hypothetical protein